ncbi:MAG: chorismate mutase [Bacteroidales bacterium]
MEKEILPQLLPLSSWNSSSKPLIIAGPCSAESPEQLLSIANSLKKTNSISYLRAGVWKPRTTPNSFEGYGSEALSWLRDVKRETGLPFSTEVGSHQHVYEALKFGADLIWVGARTVSNPFAMQEIADALKGVDIPVFVKNPLSPDIELWEGAIRRLYNAGIYKLGAIHRGFTLWNKSVFRNQPLWDIPLQLKMRHPNLPIICDPSHITGKRNLVPLVAQRAMNLRFDGLMVEVHPYPDIALSDSAQQLTPAQFEDLLRLIIREVNVSESQSGEMLDELRAEIDIMDDLLVWALSNRMELAGKIASVKRTEKMPVLQTNRWDQVLERVTSKGVESGLRPQFLRKVFQSIHKESLGMQSELIANENG